jgi:hypothetical protein
VKEIEVFSIQDDTKHFCVQFWNIVDEFQIDWFVFHKRSPTHFTSIWLTVVSDQRTTVDKSSLIYSQSDFNEHDDFNTKLNSFISFKRVNHSYCNQSAITSTWYVAFWPIHVDGWAW